MSESGLGLHAEELRAAVDLEDVAEMARISLEALSECDRVLRDIENLRATVLGAKVAVVMMLNHARSVPPP